MKFYLIINKFLLLFSHFFIFSHLVNAQDPCDLNSFSLEEIYFNDEIVAFYLGAIDLDSGSSNLLLFDYSIESSDFQNCYNSNSRIYFHFSIFIYSPELGFNDFEEFLKSSFLLSEIQGPLRFRNTDMNFATNSISGAESERKEYILGSELSDIDVQTIINYIMQSGKIPNGSYIFEAKLSSDVEGEEVISHASKQVDVYEPKYINLISPGGSLSDTLSTIVYSPYPVFYWESDNCSSSNCNIGIRVCEFNPNDHSSLSEAIESNSLIPIDQSIDFFTLDSTAMSFQYPILGAESLVEGNYYVWQLNRTYLTTVGEESLYSDIFVFKLHSFENVNLSISSNLELIKKIIGDDRYRIFFGTNGDLSPYVSEISTIFLDGKEITISNLYDFLVKVEQNKVEIIEVKSD